VSAHYEDARQWVHALSGLFALLLRVLTWPQAAALAVAALVFNAMVLPRVGGQRLYRPVDRARGFPLGILLYPLAVLLLVLVFPSRLDLAAAAWAILAFGDGAATLAGRRIGVRALRWNPDKTFAGTAAFVVCGAAGGVATALWTRPAASPEPTVLFAILAPAAASLVAAFVETIPIRLDDNLSVPAAAAATLWLASRMTPAAFAASRETILAALPWAAGVNIAVSWLGHRLRTVSLSGAVVGAIVGCVIYAGAGGGAWLMLFAAFLAASVTSRLGLRRKALLGVAEERGGRRGAGNALANCGMAAAAAVAAATTPRRDLALLALVAALTAGGSDTVASEIGKAWGRATFLVTTLRRVSPGTPGAVSLEGSAAGIVAAFALAALGVALGLMPGAMILAVVLAATAGAVVESALGATLEGPGILNNDMLNFINTAVAATIVLTLV
jgi:uncharacterized protein (TIGR00297 family)